MYNRREFLKRSAIATTGAAVISSPLMASISNPLATGSSIKNIGLQVWSIAKTLEKDLTGTLQLLSKIGYKEIELFGPYPFSTQKDKDAWKVTAPMVGFSQSGYFNHTAREFKDILDRHGLRTSAMHIGLDTMRNNLGQTADAMHVLGQQYVGLAFIPAEERTTLDGYKRIADEFNVIGEKAKALGIRFYYHNHGYGLTPVDGKIPFDIILERTDPSLLYLEMDIFWTTAGGADPIKYLDKYPGRFKLMHVKDMTKLVRFSGDGGDPGQWVELFPYITDAGSGVLDLKNILTHAKKSGLEHFILENDVIKDLNASLENGYKYLSSVEVGD